MRRTSLIVAAGVAAAALSTTPADAKDAARAKAARQYAKVALAPGTPPREGLKSEVVPGQLVIRWLSNTRPGARAAVVRAAGGKTLDWFDQFNTSLVDVPELRGKKHSLEEVLVAFKRVPGVFSVEPNPIVKEQGTWNDPFTSRSLEIVDMEQAWATAKQTGALGNGVQVAVVDAGHPLRTHSELDTKVIGGYDVIDGNSSAPVGEHATRMAGIIGAETDNGQFTAGICPNCAIMPVNIADDFTSTPSKRTESYQLSAYNVAKGIVYAADAGARVINLSLASSGGSSTVEQAVNYAWNKGSFLSCAAGQFASRDWDGSYRFEPVTYSYPAAYGNCFAVTTTNGTGFEREHASSWWIEAGGPYEMLGPGYFGEFYGIKDQSNAAAVVSGVAGMLASRGISNWTIRERLCVTADKLSVALACGELNAARAVSTSAPPAGTAAPNAIPNGSFESGPVGWRTGSAANYGLVEKALPYRGSWGLWLADYENAYDTAEQTVSITPERSKLSIRWQVRSKEYGSYPYDRMQIRILSQHGTLLGTLGTFTNGNVRNTWQQAIFPLHQFVGQNVKVQFEARNDGSLPTGFFVDDVELIP